MSIGRDLARLWRSGGFRKLATTRLLSQAGDGMFQVGIATAFFFEPEKAGTPAEIAQGFAVMLAPFTLVGPFVGPLIDRWSRQRILVVGNTVRLVLVGALAAAVATHAPLPVLYACALLVLSINRFLLAAMTAGLPQVVDRDELLTANAILPTLGTIAAAAGAALGGIVTFVAPTTSDLSLAFAALLGSAVMLGLAAAAALRLTRAQLGPEEPALPVPLAAQVRALGVELAQGMRYMAARRTPLHALGVMGAQRALYALMFAASILISRHVLGDPAHPEKALENFTIVVGFAAVGFGAAAVLTPILGARISRHRWILWCLGVGAAGQTLLATSSAAWALLSAAVVVSFAVQGAKIAVDTIIQRDTDDAVRGRAFTLYDMVYNVAFIGAACLGALVLPPSGYSATVMAVLAVLYVVVAAVYSRAPRSPRELAHQD